MNHCSTILKALAAVDEAYVLGGTANLERYFLFHLLDSVRRKQINQ